MGQEAGGGSPEELLPRAATAAVPRPVGSTVVGTERPSYDALPPRQPMAAGNKPLLWVSRPQLEQPSAAASASVQALLSGYGLGPASSHLWPGHPAVRVGVANTSTHQAQRQDRLRSLEKSLDKGRKPSSKAYPPAIGKGQPAWNKGAGSDTRKVKVKQGTAAASASRDGHNKAARLSSRTVGVQVNLDEEASTEPLRTATSQVGERPVALTAVAATDGKLSGLCEEDKQKVSKLIRQVVDLGGEIRRLEVELTQAYEGRENVEARQAEESQKLRAISKENSKLKKKLSHALDMIRSYQARFEIMSELPPPSSWAAAQQDPPPVHPTEHQQPLGGPQPAHPQSLVTTPVVSRPPAAGHHPHLASTSGAATPSSVSVITIRPDETVRIASTPAGSMQVMEASPPEGYHTVRRGAGEDGRDELAEAVRRLDAMVNAPEEYYGVPVGFRVEDNTNEYSLLGPPRPRVLKYDPNLGENGAFYFVDVDEQSRSQGGSPVKQPQQHLTSAHPEEMLSLLDSVQRGSAATRVAQSESFSLAAINQTCGPEPAPAQGIPPAMPEPAHYVSDGKQTGAPRASLADGQRAPSQVSSREGAPTEHVPPPSHLGNETESLPRPYISASEQLRRHQYSSVTSATAAAAETAVARPDPAPDSEAGASASAAAFLTGQEGSRDAAAAPVPPQRGFKRPLSPSPAASAAEDPPAAAPHLDLRRPEDSSNDEGTQHEETVAVEALQVTQTQSLSSEAQATEEVTTTEVLSGITASTAITEATHTFGVSYHVARPGTEPSPGSSLSSLPVPPDAGRLSSTAHLLLNTPSASRAQPPEETSARLLSSEHRQNQIDLQPSGSTKAADSESSPDVSRVVSSVDMRSGGDNMGRLLRPRSAARQSPVAAETEAAGRPAAMRYVTDLSGFDDSLMDLVSEVESMELGSPARSSASTLDLNFPPHTHRRTAMTQRQTASTGVHPANAALPASSAWPHSPRTLPLSAQATRLTPYRTPGATLAGSSRAGSEGGWMRRGLFEENDIISTIMDAEELARSLYSEAGSTSNPG